MLSRSPLTPRKLNARRHADQSRSTPAFPRTPRPARYDSHHLTSPPMWARTGARNHSDGDRQALCMGKDHFGRCKSMSPATRLRLVTAHLRRLVRIRFRGPPSADRNTSARRGDGGGESRMASLARLGRADAVKEEENCGARWARSHVVMKRASGSCMWRSSWRQFNPYRMSMTGAHSCVTRFESIQPQSSKKKHNILAYEQ
jgi:hypothetical protein